MNIGRKIKTIRIEKLMTQNELAGDIITRNMLSQIENGNATPSLTTVCHLAKKLGVPAGYLLSEGEEEFIYNKTRVMRNIKKAYLDKNYEWCREMCESSFDEYDDEIELILTDCCMGEAESLIRNGKLYQAREMLDEALYHAQKTIYSTAIQQDRRNIMFYLLKSISPTLDSNESDTDISKDFLNPELFGDVFCKYITILLNPGQDRRSDNDKFEKINYTSDYDKLFISHIQAREKISMGEYRKAANILRSIMDGDTAPERLLLFICCEDMEKCCKEMEDYKGAYEFSNNKLEILEHMLAEV